MFDREASFKFLASIQYLIYGCLADAIAAGGLENHTYIFLYIHI